jgi:hypothetical protein
MRWHSSAVRFRKLQGTLASFARSLNLSVLDLQEALRGHFEDLSLSDEQLEEIRRWNARRERFRKVHPTAAALARSLGISRSTLFLCIQRKGLYQTSETGGIEETNSSQSRREVDVTSGLLRNWRRVEMDRA